MPTEIPAELHERLINSAERLLWEIFERHAHSYGMSQGYRDSLTIKKYGNNLVVRLRYLGNEDVPLGIWFEYGTHDHYIRPNFGHIALMWHENGEQYFSRGHWVSGIEPRRIMTKTRDDFAVGFQETATKEVEAFYAR